MAEGGGGGAKAMDYYKSLQPTQLIAERGLELVVINPGSSNLRVGLGSWQDPVVVPHCVAWHSAGNGKCEDSGTRNGAIGEQVATLPVLRRDREEMCLKVEALLGVPGNDTNGMDVSKEEVVRGGYVKCEQEKKLELPWTQVMERANDECAPVYRRCICGEEALRIPASQPYVLRRPMCRGRLNVSPQYPMQQVCDDMYAIWNWVLAEKMLISKAGRRNLSAVLVVPDTFDNREVKEVVSVLLRDLEFHSVVVHQECVSATFGNGVSSACVVQMGAQDGVSISVSQKILPYGGEDISRCLLWVQQRHGNWPLLKTDPLTNSLDMTMLDRLKQAHCALSVGGDLTATADVFSCTPGESDLYKVTLVALNVPPAGLFYPSLLTPEERMFPPRSWYYSDHEDMLVDPVEAGMTAFSNEQFTNGHSSALSPSGNSLLGLHEAIVSSVLSMGRLDLKMKFFSSILLVGGVASTPGIAEFIEDKIVHTVSHQEGIDKVEVLSNRADPSILSWKGGVVLGVLDFSRESWIQRSDWIDGGLRVGSSKKYKDSLSLHAQAFWYNAVLDWPILLIHLESHGPFWIVVDLKGVKEDLGSGLKQEMMKAVKQG
ncbi:hypothetical protein SELMODRAFT_425688 [Selaginella moellendorffii]|uniref:Actin-related protein 8 n=1 Tax=Selaginella moellendorffii TaxID=88036 RepID=D8STY8_SELML|nr:hypothetical protein SELMODRAFT_425688 [Selaginella moellendorffii]